MRRRRPDGIAEKIDVKLVEEWEKIWEGMPPYDSADRVYYSSVIVHFKDKKGKDDFFELLGERQEEANARKQTLWFPHEEEVQYNVRKDYSPAPPNHWPIYIISKGRADTRLTAKSLERLSIPYRIVVEPQEEEEYASVIDRKKILVLPFSNLGQGGIPARNWVWEHSISGGWKKHWILDDNIDGFYRVINNRRMKIMDENPFRPVERLTGRYSNVALAGLNYYMFNTCSTKIPPFFLNTRIYSCILIQNDIPYRWRGRYNEDTDLSLRALKDGWCTILLNAYLAKKTPTMRMKGGNTDELYKQNEEMDGRRLMAESLKEQHPDVTTVTYKWGRWQHQVDYRPFKRNKLVEK